MFRDAYRGRRKKEKPNSMRRQPTLSFRCDLDGETLGYIQRLKAYGDRSKFINSAIKMKYFADRYPRGFILQLMQNNYLLCKHFLRQIGSAFSEMKNKEANSRGQNTQEEKEDNAEK